MNWRKPEPRTLEIRAIRGRERTRNGHWFLPCETSDGVAVFWGSDDNLDNIQLIEAGRAPFKVTCGCIASRWPKYDLWVPEHSRIEMHRPEEFSMSEDDSSLSAEPVSLPLHDRAIDAKYADCWMEAMELVTPRLRGLLSSLFRRRVPTPVVGYELAGDRGALLAESELAWPAWKIAVVLAEHSESRGSFEQAGWRVFEEGAEKLVETVAAALDE